MPLCNFTKGKVGKAGEHHWYRYCNNQIMSKIISSCADWGSKGATWRSAVAREAGPAQSLALPPLGRLHHSQKRCSCRRLILSAISSCIKQQTKRRFSGRDPEAYLDLIAFHCLGLDVLNKKDLDNFFECLCLNRQCSMKGKNLTAGQHSARRGVCVAQKVTALRKEVNQMALILRRIAEQPRSGY